MNNKILTGISIIIILLIIGFGFMTRETEETAVSDADLVEYEDNVLLLDTMNTVRVYAPGEEAGREAVDQVFARLEEIDQKLDIYKEDSEVSRINQNAGGEPVEVSQETFDLLRDSVELARELEGDFDPTIGALTLLWGWGSADGPAVPPEEEIEAMIDLVDYDKINFDDENTAVSLAEEGMELDLGAIAKGYASVEAYNILEETEVDSAFIDLGGNITLKDIKPDETPWRIGIQNPRAGRGDVMAAVSVDEEDIERHRAIVTSGDYERYFEEDGEEYHHIIDPATGYPSDHGIISTTIITEDPLKADAYSTGILVRGLPGRDLIEEQENMEAIFINDDMEVYVTSGIEDELEIFDDDFTVVDWDELTD